MNLRRIRPLALLSAIALPLLAGCQSTGVELSGLAAQPPLDYAVLVTGGAFLSGSDPATDTFVDSGTAINAGNNTGNGSRSGEPVAITDVLDVLRDGAVFRRLGLDADDAHRRAILPQLRAATGEPQLLDFLQRARDDGYDLLLVVEQLQNGGIEAQGVNGRWPLTIATWLMLGVGVFIPDHTYESRATLRVLVCDLQTGRIVHTPLLVAGPIDLALVERGNFLGLLLSIVVPPFWVHDDRANVRTAIGNVTMRRLLLQLARDLKSEPVRGLLRDALGAGIALVDRRLRIESKESLTSVRLRPAGGTLGSAAVQQFERELLGSLRSVDGRFVYEAELPTGLAPGALQVLVGTLTGGVASATLVVPGSKP